MASRYDTPMREEDLQAYVDGLLDRRRSAEVEAYLARHEEEAERITAYRAQNVILHQAFDFVVKEPLPAAVENMAERLAHGERPGVFRRSLRGASVAAALVIAVSAGWVARDQLLPVSSATDTLAAFTQRAMQAHVLLTGEESPPFLGKGTEGGNALVGWLSQRFLSTSRPAPDLSTFGLTLTGSRLFFMREQLVVQLNYEGEKHRLSLYVGTSPKENLQTTFSFAQEGQLSTFYWRQASLEFSLVGHLDRDQLLSVAKAVQAQLDTTPTPSNDATAPATVVQPVSSGKDTGPRSEGTVVPVTPAPSPVPSGGKNGAIAVPPDKPSTTLGGEKKTLHLEPAPRRAA